MKHSGIEREVRTLTRGFKNLPKEDQELLWRWFAPKARTIDQVCRAIAISAPEMIRNGIKQCGATANDASS